MLYALLFCVRMYAVGELFTTFRKPTVQDLQDTSHKGEVCIKQLIGIHLGMIRVYLLESGQRGNHQLAHIR